MVQARWHRGNFAEAPMSDNRRIAITNLARFLVLFVLLGLPLRLVPVVL